MNDNELDQLLKSAKAPARPEEYWESFPTDVTRSLNRPLREPEPKRWLPRLAWAGAFAAVCIVAGYLIGHQAGHQEAGNGQLLQNEKLIREVMAMFPNRVRAIVKDDSGMQLVLSDEANVPDSMPIWVKVCQGEHCTTLVTFSGQEVEVAGQKMTVLADAENGVILAGDRFVWASDEPSAAQPQLRIQARPIQVASK